MTEADLLSDIDPVLRRRDPNVSEATSAVRAYIAGPMRGIAGLNFPAFDAAAVQLRAAGYEVWSPAEHDRASGFDPTGMTGHEDLAEYGFSLRDALIRDMTEVARSDFLCLLDGWENSLGATAERALAEALLLTVGTLEEFLDAEPMTEHEYLVGSIAPALNDLVPQVWASAYGQAEKDRDARLDRLDHFLTSSSELRDLREHYDNTDVSAEIEKAVWSCSNCDGNKCMSCVTRTLHDECCDDCPDCCPDLPAIIFPAEVRITSETGGQKGTKLARFDLIPTRPLWAVAELYGYGAGKYKEARNWEKGYDWSLSYAALQRHANLFWSRENDDAETGLPHLAAVAFHALALMEYRTTHPEFDDRPGR